LEEIKNMENEEVYNLENVDLNKLSEEIEYLNPDENVKLILKKGRNWFIVNRKNRNGN
jgi:hypothetical protein